MVHLVSVCQWTHQDLTDSAVLLLQLSFSSETNRDTPCPLAHTNFQFHFRKCDAEAPPPLCCFYCTHQNTGTSFCFFFFLQWRWWWFLSSGRVFSLWKLHNSNIQFLSVSVLLFIFYRFGILKYVLFTWNIKHWE